MFVANKLAGAYDVCGQGMMSNGAAIPMLTGAAVDGLCLWFVQEAEYAAVRRVLCCADMADVLSRDLCKDSSLQ